MEEPKEKHFDLRFSVVKRCDNFYGTFYLLLDEMRYTYVDEYVESNFIPAGSATINIELTAGQVVRIENAGSTMIYGTHSTGYIYSWFTGHLLHAL